EQRNAADASKAMYDKELKARRFDAITTEILDAPQFYFAEDYHQQYLAKNPMGYCGLGGTGVSCPIGVAHKATQSAQALTPLARRDDGRPAAPMVAEREQASRVGSQLTFSSVS